MKDTHKAIALTAIIMTFIFAAYTIGRRSALEKTIPVPEQEQAENNQSTNIKPKTHKKQSSEPIQYNQNLESQPTIDESMTPESTPEATPEVAPDISDFRTQITSERIKMDLIGRKVNYNLLGAWRFDSVDEFISCSILEMAQISEGEVRVNASCVMRDIENSKSLGMKLYLQYFLTGNYWQLHTIKVLDYKKGNL